MPIYEYRCTACQHKLEALQKFSDAQLTVCPQCGQDALTKLVSAAGFHLKGSGWYQTDFKNSGSKPARQARRRGRRSQDGETKTGGPEDGRDAGGQARHARRQSRDCGRASKQSTGRRRSQLARASFLMKRYLVAGLLVWVPLGITIWVLHFLVTTLDQTLLLFPEGARPDALLGLHIPGFGVLLSFGDPAADRRRRRELLRRAPHPLLGGLLRPHSGRQVDLLVGQAGQRHAAVRFRQRVPQGAAGRVSARERVDDRVHDRDAGPRTWPPICREEHVSVYVPTTPNPTSGYFIIVPKSRVRELDMTVDEALKYVISMGVVAPRVAGPAARGPPPRRSRARAPPTFEIDRADAAARHARPRRGVRPAPIRLPRLIHARTRPENLP